MKRDGEMELLLKLREQQPGEFKILEPSLKLKALEYEAEQRGAQMAEFEANEYYEALILLERDEPKRYAAMSEVTHRTVEYYKQAKARAEKAAA